MPSITGLTISPTGSLFTNEEFVVTVTVEDTETWLLSSEGYFMLDSDENYVLTSD